MIVATGFTDELLLTVRVPVWAPWTDGSNPTLKVFEGVVEFRVNGKLAPEKENPVPATVIELTVTGAAPVEVRVSD